MTDLDEIRAILRDVALQQRATQQQIDSNARMIAANSTAIAELRQQQQETHALLTEEVGTLVTMITTLSDQMQVDRQETTLLRAEVRSLIQALRDRFGSNRHGKG